jgi:hypothetical protein
MLAYKLFGAALAAAVVVFSFAPDSPQEGSGFETFAGVRFAPDSQLEGAGFEPSVPLT